MVDRVAIAALALLLALGVLASVRRLPDRSAPAQIPAASCSAWMADAVPGVGLKRREAVAAQIRAGAIPPAAKDWFTP